MAELSILSDGERKSIRSKIEKALCLDLPEDAVIIQSPSNIAHHVGKLREDMKQASVGAKLNSLMRNAFSIKSETQMLLEAKLRKLKDAIAARKIVYTSFGNRTLSPDLAAILYEIYRFVEILGRQVSAIFEDTSGVERIIRQFLEHRIPGAKTALTDFITVEEMKGIFFKTESRIELVGEITRRLQDYSGDIAAAQLDQYAAGIVPLYYFRSLIAFSFQAFFNEFRSQSGGENGDGGDSEYSGDTPSFQSARLQPALDLLETLYCLLHPLKKLDPDTPVYPELLEMSYRYTSGELLSESDVSGDAPEARGMELSGATEKFLKDIKNLMTVTQRVLANVPLVELIRYYKNDPYYKLMIYPPRLKLTEFYQESLRLKIIGEFELYFPQLHRRIFEEVQKDLFSREPDDFDYFMNSGLGMTPKKGYAEFSFPGSLKILNAFIRTHYYAYMQGLIHSLNKVMAHRIRSSFSQLLVHAGSIENIGTKLRNFDLSFSPDAEDGKQFIRLKFVLDKELSQQKSYVQLVTRKNDEMKSLLDSGIAILQGIYVSLSAIRKDSAFISDAATRIPGIEKIIDRSVDALFKAGKLIRYSMLTEKGTY
ncbi:MAG: hypothetical protein LBK44_01490 [Spirochaetales bacterium]|jgi:hypothetical protein|nr:hypothetical protein [Spirochaetales bacterium]